MKTFDKLTLLRTIHTMQGLNFIYYNKFTSKVSKHLLLIKLNVKENITCSTGTQTCDEAHVWVRFLYIAPNFRIKFKLNDSIFHSKTPN